VALFTVVLSILIVVFLGATSQGAEATCTATTVRNSDTSFISNHRGECYRVQAQARRYFGGGVYQTVTASASTYRSQVNRSPGQTLDSQRVRAQPVNDASTTWSSWK